MNPSTRFYRLLFKICLAILLTNACDSPQSKKATTYSIIVDQVEKIGFNDLFRLTDKSIQLETREDIILGADLHIEFDKEDIYVLDNSASSLYRFDHVGKFLTRIGQQGKGPAEYLRISHFYFDNDGVTITYNEGTTINLFSYDYDGKYLVSRKLEGFATSGLKKLGNSYWLYTGPLKFMHDHRLYQLDSGFNITGSYFKNDFSGDPLDVQEQNFIQANKKLYLHESCYPTIHEITADTIQSKYELDYGKDAIPDEFWSMDGIGGFEMLLKKGAAYTRYFVPGENYTLIGVLFQKQGEPGRIELIIHDMVNDKYKKAELSENDPLTNFKPVKITPENEIVFLGWHQLLQENEQSNETAQYLSNPVLKYYNITF